MNQDPLQAHRRPSAGEFPPELESVVPVLDLRERRAVHARGGNRQAYQPLRSVWNPDAGADPLRVARALRDASRGRLARLYVADLDAIAGQPPVADVHRALLDQGWELWLDPGIRTPESLDALPPTLLDHPRLVLVAGLETLASPDALPPLVRRLGPRRLVFGLDLRDAAPLASSPAWPDDPLRVAAIARRAGIPRVLLLDLAAVGAESGLPPKTLALLRNIPPPVAVGGGVRSPDDVRAWLDAGADAVLVGTALHNGRIPPPIPPGAPDPTPRPIHWPLDSDPSPTPATKPPEPT